MVTTKLWGRTGNQMFMIAAAIGYARTRGLEYHIPPKTVNNNLWPPAFVHLHNKGYKKNKPVVKISEEGHAYQELPFKDEWSNINIELSGYWQSEKYFDHCREDILSAFNIPGVSKDGVCSIHVRRGDYLLPDHVNKHPVCSIQYLADAMRLIQSKGHYRFLVFSDDIDWCKQNLNDFHFHEYHFDYSDNIKPMDDIGLMSSCEHNIVSNSTFSWWGAWLNQNPGKVVVSPSKENWFGPGNAHLDTSDLIPKNWFQIKY